MFKYIHGGGGAELFQPDEGLLTCQSIESASFSSPIDFSLSVILDTYGL